MRSLTSIKLLFFATGILFALAGCEKKFEENKDTYEIMVGETFTINLGENLSTGYSNCWINKLKAGSISLIRSEHFRKGSYDCNGCGGTTVYTFKGIAEGIDTIIMANLPAIRDQKDCSAYPEDSVRIDKKFIITVKK